MIGLALVGGALAAPLVGTYDFELVTVTAAEVPVIGAVEATTRSRMIATIAPHEGGFVQTHDVCAVTIEGATDLARTVLPEAFLAAMAQARYPVTLTPDGDGWRYVADMGELAVGYDPAAAAGALPASSDDPGVVDWDRDGQPGATVRIEVPLLQDVEVRVVQRSHAVLEGRVEGAGVAGGARLLRFEQAVLSATHKLFTRAPKVLPAAGGWFSMTPVPAGTTCAELSGR